MLQPPKDRIIFLPFNARRVGVSYFNRIDSNVRNTTGLGVHLKPGFIFHASLLLTTYA